MPRMIGIDLGTSTSSVAVCERGQPPRMLALDERDRIMPSVVTFDPGGQVVVGRKARPQRATNPEYTYTELKRLLGRQEDDKIVAEIRERVSYDIARGPNGEAWVRGPDRAYAPEELLGYVVRELKRVASTVLGETVTHAVIGVPANFDQVQRAAVRRAARFGGIEPIGDNIALLSESNAAAIAYGMERGPGKTIAVYDLGGGTFDSTILKVAGMSKLRVLASAGDAYLGGEDFDNRIVNWLAEQFRLAHGLDLRQDVFGLQRLQLKAEAAKIELSGADEFRIIDRFIAKDPMTGAQVDLDYTLSRDVFEELVQDLVDRTRQPCLDAMAAAKIDPRRIDDVVMVGGMTRVPVVQQAIEEIFGRKPLQRINPIEAVALGCAIQAAARAGELASIALTEVTTSSFGLEASGGAFVPFLKRGSQIPNAKTLKTAAADETGTEVALRIFQGDLNVAREGRHLGTLIVPVSAGGDVAVTFDIDQDGMLTVEATDLATGAVATKAMHADLGLDREALENLRRMSEDDQQGPLDDDPADPVDEPVDPLTPDPLDDHAGAPTSAAGGDGPPDGPGDDLDDWMDLPDPADGDQRQPMAG
jgi:molecular chaperone DnaK